MLAESNEQSERLKQSLKEERQTRKKFESKVEHIEEELNDLRNEKESLEKVIVLICLSVQFLCVCESLVDSGLFVGTGRDICLDFVCDFFVSSGLTVLLKTFEFLCIVMLEYEGRVFI